MKKSLYILAILLIALQSCDYVDRKIACNKGIDPNYHKDTATTTTIQQVRKVLVEDYTGHVCVNCPKAARVIDALESTYGNKIVPLALHVTPDFAAPVTPGFPEDFRTNEGTTLDGFFKVSVPGLPGGMVNRIGYPNNNILAYGSWTSTVAAQLALPIDAFITITNTYTSSPSSVSTSIKTKFINAQSGDIKLCVFLTEDSIIGQQKDSTAIDNPYYFNHMLRASFVGGAWGEVIKTNPAANDSITKSYSLVLSTGPNSWNIWNASHCNVLAFIYNATTYQVLQAEVKRVK